MARLRADNFRRLRAFLAARGQPRARSFQRWAVSFAARTAIDYVRAHAEYHRPSRDDDGAVRASGSRWAGFEPAPDSKSAPAAGTDVARLVMAQRILARAREVLSAPQCEALTLWLGDEDSDEIARRLGLRDGDCAAAGARGAEAAGAAPAAVSVA